MRVCEACKHKSTPPQELLDLYTEMRRFFSKVFYCKLLNVVKCYNPQIPSQMFVCELFEPTESAQ